MFYTNGITVAWDLPRDLFMQTPDPFLEIQLLLPLLYFKKIFIMFIPKRIWFENDDLHRGIPLSRWDQVASSSSLAWLLSLDLLINQFCCEGHQIKAANLRRHPIRADQTRWLYHNVLNRGQPNQLQFWVILIEFWDAGNIRKRG